LVRRRRLPHRISLCSDLSILHNLNRTVVALADSDNSNNRHNLRRVYSARQRKLLQIHKHREASSEHLHKLLNLLPVSSVPRRNHNSQAASSDSQHSSHNSNRRLACSDNPRHSRNSRIVFSGSLLSNSSLSSNCLVNRH